jgi:type II secretory pathway component HofQ
LRQWKQVSTSLHPCILEFLNLRFLITTTENQALKKDLEANNARIVANLENSQKQLLDLQTKRTEAVEKTLSETKQSYDKVIERQQVASQDLTIRLLEAQASHTSASVALQNRVNTL